MLEAMINTRGVLQHCKDYAKALLEGLNKRFKHLESDKKFIGFSVSPEISPTVVAE
jgi:hypothetical protein